MKLAPREDKEVKDCLKRIKDVDIVDLPNFIAKLEHAINDKKGEYGEALTELLEELTTTDACN